MSKKRRLVKAVFNYMLITLGAFLYAIGVSFFLDPNSLAPGGVSGLAIILNRFVPVETGTLILIINIPIMMLGIWKFGIRFTISTIYCTVMSSVFINLLAPVGALSEDLLLSALVGGSLMAIGLGLVFKAGATTGGTDIIVKVLRIKYPHLKTGNLFLLIDASIVTLSAFAFKDLDKALYAGITVIVASLVMDLVLYGRDEAKLIYVISDKSETITKRLLEELDVGVTYVHGEGAFSGKEKKVIMCVVKKAMAPRVEEVVKEEDPIAFMIISSATEIFGEGYKNFFSEKM